MPPGINPDGKVLLSLRANRNSFIKDLHINADTNPSMPVQDNHLPYKEQ
jgi:hypothetical protein